MNIIACNITAVVQLIFFKNYQTFVIFRKFHLTGVGCFRYLKNSAMCKTSFDKLNFDLSNVH